METFSALLAICAENSPVPGEFPTQRPVTRSFDVYFDLRPNKRLSKQSWGWWFETQSRPLWRHRNGLGGKQLLHISVTNQLCDSYMSINPSGGCENRNLLRAKTVRKTVGCTNFNDRFDYMAETLYTRTKRCYHLNRPSSQLNHISKRGRWCHQTFSKIILSLLPWHVGNCMIAIGCDLKQNRSYGFVFNNVHGSSKIFWRFGY